MRLFSIVLVFICFTFQSIQLLGQQSDVVPNDTVEYDSLTHHLHDTLSTRIPYETSPVKDKRSLFFDSLKVKANQKSWSRQLHNLLVIELREKADATIGNGYNRTDYFEEFNGSIIRKINIKQLDVFGPSVYDTAKTPRHWSQKLGNSLHISTHKSAVRSYLFFEEGERIDPYLFADNERILRTIPNIQDSRIYLQPVEGQNGYVDVLIVVKDVWPIGFGLEVFDVIYGNVSVWNNNMLGLGHQLGYTAYYNSEREPNFGYKANYKVPNIGNTLVSFNIFHEDTWNLLTTKVHLTRDFITPAMIFGGGAGYEKNFRISNVITIDSIFEDVISDNEYYEAWFGYSLPIKRLNSQRLRKTLFTTSRVMIYNYFVRPEVESNFFYNFHDRRILLGSLGIAWQGFHNTRLVYGFGDTEDLPFGAMLKLTGGREWSEFANRLYLGGTATWSVYMKKYGFLSNTLELGSFFNNSSEQGVFKYKLLHFSPLLGNNRHGFRQFTSLEFNQGFNRFSDEYTSIFRNEGIRGLDYLTLRGDKKLSVNLELVYYSPHYLYGFRFVYFGFFDAGVINFQRNTIFDNPIYSSLGVGIRIRNERLVFNTVQLRFQFFPFNSDLPVSSKEILELSGQPKVRMPDFANRKPYIIEY